MTAAAGETRRLVLFDGSGLIYRSYFALARQGLATSAGEPTGAVYGVTTTLLKILREQEPDYLAFLLDARGPTFRHQQLPTYKESRPGMPDDLRVQIPRLRAVLDALRISTIELAGFEADDLIATLAHRGAGEGMEVLIVSADKDLLQLVGGPVRALVPGRGRGEEMTFLDADGVREKLGVPPAQVVDLFSLTGDAIDDIPGIDGLGQKGAAKLLEEHGTIEGILEHLEEIRREKVREELREHRERVLANRDLVRVRTDAPLEISWEDLRATPVEAEAVLPVFRELEFKRLVESFGGEVEAGAAGAGRAGGGLFDAAAEGKGTEAAREAEDAAGGSPGASAELAAPPVSSEAEVDAFLERARSGEGLALALVTGAQGTGFARPARGVSLALAGGESVHLRFADAKAAARVWRRLAGVLADERLPKWTDDLKGLWHAALEAGVELRGPLRDAGLAVQLRDAGLPRAGASVRELLGVPEPARRRARPREGELALDGGGEEEDGEARGLAAALAGALARETPALMEDLRGAGLARLYQELEIPLAGALARMERNGIAVDVAGLKSLSNDMARRMAELEARIHEEAGGPFNIHSTKQLKDVLFGTLELKPGRRTKSGFSTDANVLSRLAREHPLPGLILDYRHLSKLRSTYAEALPQMVNERTGRIHTTFDQAIAATGRISSRDPNLQNIPIRTGEGRAFRRVFRAGEEGWHLVVADYSQIELRVLAHLAPDEGLREAFLAGADFHQATAAAVFDLPAEEVTGEMRNRAKAVNYGILYGMGPRAMAQNMEIPEKEAKTFIENYFTRFPGVKAFIEETLEEARERGYVTTLSGRRRTLPDLRSPRRELRAFAERAAVNARIQGTAADIMKAALVGLDAELAESGSAARLLLTVHDELVLEAPADDALPALLDQVVKVMESPAELRVPLEVTVGHGPTWLDAHA